MSGADQDFLQMMQMRLLLRLDWALHSSLQKLGGRPGLLPYVNFFPQITHGRLLVLPGLLFSRIILVCHIHPHVRKPLVVPLLTFAVP
jgi:hypothetical protein